MNRTGRTGLLLLACIAGAALAAPVLTPHSPDRHFEQYPTAPPMRPHVVHTDGSWRRPFVYPLRLVDRLERRYEEDRSRPLPIRWFADGYIASIDETGVPWLPLGSDPLGRDVFARLLYGARISLGVAAVASIAALLLGLLIGGSAGMIGGRVESALMTLADFVLVLPAIYVVLAIRAALPLVLSVRHVFLALTVVLAVAGWPLAARGVRAIVAAEKNKEYAEAAYAMGGSPLRILLRHLLPATTGFLVSVWTMMVPAFVLTEATVSLVGLGFPAPTATWGAMLQDASNDRSFTEAPWLLSPAAAIVITTLALYLVTTSRTTEPTRPGTFS